MDLSLEDLEKLGVTNIQIAGGKAWSALGRVQEIQIRTIRFVAPTFRPKEFTAASGPGLR